MIPTILTLEEAQSRLKEVIEKLAPGEEVNISENQVIVARLVGARKDPSSLPPPGLAKGVILYMSPDFDEPLEEFKEYME